MARSGTERVPEMPPETLSETLRPNAVAATWTPVARLRPWAGNPRKNANVVATVAQSIIRFGWGAVILAREENGEIIAGHTRVAAAELLRVQWSTLEDAARAKWHADAVRVVEGGVVPVRFGSWTEQEAHALALADNKLNELAEWDETKVAGVLAELTFNDAKLTGFDLGKMVGAIRGSNRGRKGGESGTDAQLTGLKYSVVVTCKDEAHQLELIERFDAEGLKCKPLIS